MQSDNRAEMNDPEAAWRTPSSAGQPTQYLSTPMPPHPALSARPHSAFPAGRRNNAVALTLLALGVLMFFGRLGTGFVGGGTFVPGMILLTIASCFLFFSFWRRVYGLLIPGCILAGLSLGVTFVDLTGGASVLWGLSLGFVAIYLLGRDLFHRPHPWPIFPAVPLFAVGIIVSITQISTFFPLGNSVMWLPILLIGAGLYLGWGRRTS